MRLPIIILLLNCSFAFSQERPGLSFGQYSGLNATSLNPSFSFNSANKWDVQIAGGQVFAQSNYAYITDASLWTLARSNSNDIYIRKERNDIPTESYPLQVIFNEKEDFNIDVKAEILGPGVMLSFGDKIKAGISTKARIVGSSYDIPEVFNFYQTNDFNPDTTFRAAPVHGSIIAFTELDVHFATEVNDHLVLGVTAKYLRGEEAVFASNNIEFAFSQIDENYLDILSDGNFTYFHTTQRRSETYVGQSSGVGLDLGLSLQEPLGEGTQLGLSLLDLGYIRYRGIGNTYGFTDALVLEDLAYLEATTLEELTTLLSADFDIISSQEEMVMILPLAFSVQYRHRLQEHISIEGQLTQRIKIFEQQAARSNSLNITGIYDRKHFSAFLPVTLYNYNQLRVGAAIRLGPLTIGSDQVMSLFGSSDFDGFDFYTSVQVYPFKIDKSQPKKKGWDGKDKVQCYF